MGKLEKLREVNATLKTILIELETRIFIENADIDIVKNNKNNKVSKHIEIK
jgi:hypothetical protein